MFIVTCSFSSYQGMNKYTYTDFYFFKCRKLDFFCPLCFKNTFLLRFPWITFKCRHCGCNCVKNVKLSKVCHALKDDCRRLLLFLEYRLRYILQTLSHLMCDGTDYWHYTENLCAETHVYHLPLGLKAKGQFMFFSRVWVWEHESTIYSVIYKVWPERRQL